MAQIGPAIPEIEGVEDTKVVSILTPMKLLLEMITGRTPTRKKIVKLGANATAGGQINKINEIIDRLQG